MVGVFIKTESRYPISKKTIIAVVERILLEKRIKGKVEVSVSIVGNRQMRKLNRIYRNIDKTTDVLSFCLAEDKDNKIFIDPPDDVLRLGDIVISYPEALADAAEEEKLVDDKIGELVEHGLLHLLGYHHE